ncbi:unnamed protein product [Laminaria digitata]
MAQTGDYFSNEQGVALGGYDVVGYFKAHEAERGSKAFSVSIKGSTFYFANAENKAAFEKNPSAYLPAFGGYCAFAMASGNGQVPSNPETFKVYNGKLYLFYNDYYEGTPFNTIVPWNADEAKNLAQAEQNWQKLN